MVGVFASKQGIILHVYSKGNKKGPFFKLIAANLLCNVKITKDNILETHLYIDFMYVLYYILKR